MLVVGGGLSEGIFNENGSIFSSFQSQYRFVCECICAAYSQLTKEDEDDDDNNEEEEVAGDEEDDSTQENVSSCASISPQPPPSQQHITSNI